MPTKQILNVLLNTKANTQFGRKQILILLLNTKTNSQLPKQMLKFEQKRILNFYKSSDNWAHYGTAAGSSITWTDPWKSFLESE